MDISGKRIVVTGGSSGIGLATAQALGAKGARLLLTARRPGPLQDAVAQLAAAGVRLPQYFVLMTPYAVTLAVMIWVASSKSVTGAQPGALGIPFIREERR